MNIGINHNLKKKPFHKSITFTFDTLSSLSCRDFTLCLYCCTSCSRKWCFSLRVMVMAKWKNNLLRKCCSMNRLCMNSCPKQKFSHAYPFLVSFPFESFHSLAPPSFFPAPAFLSPFFHLPASSQVLTFQISRFPLPVYQFLFHYYVHYSGYGQAKFCGRNQ